MTKTCSVCKAVLSTSEFYKRPDGFIKAACKQCYMKQSSASRKRAKVNGKDWGRTTIVRKYGIEPKDYQAILDRQSGVCAICHTRPFKESLAIDHSHQTGLVRGLLCRNCNVALGNFKEDTVRMFQAIEYLCS